MLRDNADNIPEDLKGEVEGKVAAVRSALQNDDIARVETTLNDDTVEGRFREVYPDWHSLQRWLWNRALSVFAGALFT